jgi:hypothetical protein
MTQPSRAELARFERQAKPQANGCKIWMGPQGADGYARWKPSPGAKTVYVHVWVWTLHHGPIPEGMDVGHACHDRSVERGECDGGSQCPHRRCCNILHLEIQSRSENTLRQSHANRKKDFCPKGHPYNEANTVKWSDGRRRCRECLRAR